LTFGLVHGAWHGAWCWERLVPELETRGHRRVLVDLPCEDQDAGLTRYAELTADALGSADDVILVGHSLCGSAIPLVARLRPVEHLVFLCALLPERGKSATDRYASEDVFVDGFRGRTATREDGASYRPDPDAAIRCFFHDCAPRTPRGRRRGSGRSRLRHDASRGPTIRSPTSSGRRSAVGNEQCIRPEWSRTVSRDLLGVEPIELEGGHSPFLSRPAELADVLARLG